MCLQVQLFPSRLSDRKSLTNAIKGVPRSEASHRASTASPKESSSRAIPVTKTAATLGKSRSGSHRITKPSLSPAKKEGASKMSMSAYQAKASFATSPAQPAQHRPASSASKAAVTVPSAGGSFSARSSGNPATIKTPKRTPLPSARPNVRSGQGSHFNLQPPFVQTQSNTSVSSPESGAGPSTSASAQADDLSFWPPPLGRCPSCRRGVRVYRWQNKNYYYEATVDSNGRIFSHVCVPT